MLVVDAHGKSLRLGSEIGRGGEGAVFDVVAQPGQVAKIYHKPLAPARAEKLGAMVRVRTDRLIDLAAWPLTTLHGGSGGPIGGFLMPKADGFTEVGSLYSPRDRLNRFPTANWQFLVHVAANAARAVRILHEHGHVLGDINHSNLMVSQQGIVRLIDCDSFQVAAGGKLYLCEVGVAEYTPPELQRKPFHSMARTENHDAFGLAVLVFHLLFLGRHPFSGVYLGPGDLPLDRSIAEFRFAYGTDARQRDMAPPPGTLPLGGVSPEVATLFARAFSPRGAMIAERPRPEDWVPALEALAKRTVACTAHPGHRYYMGLVACPWCGIERQSGRLMFNVASVASSVIASTSGTFNLAIVWAEILAVQEPKAVLPPEIRPIANRASSAHAEQAAAARRRALRWALTLVGAVVVLLALPEQTRWLAILLAVGTLLFKRLIFDAVGGPAADLVEKLRREKTSLRGQYEQMIARWHAEATPKSFVEKRAELTRVKNDYERLPQLRQQKLSELEAKKREGQLQLHLDRQFIAHASIPAIGPARAAMLRSFGIETAADITNSALQRVPGIGPALIANLMAWRGVVERRFIYDPKQPLDPNGLNNVEREIQTLRSQLEAQLKAGAADMQRIARQTLAARATLIASVNNAGERIAQIDADLLALNRVW